MKLSDIITEYRTGHKLSQRKFAEKCGVTNGYISMLENEVNPATGKKIIPSIEKCAKLASGMGLSLHELFDMCDDIDVELDPQSDSVKLSRDELCLIDLFRGLSEEGKKSLLKQANMLVLFEKNGGVTI